MDSEQIKGMKKQRLTLEKHIRLLSIVLLFVFWTTGITFAQQTLTLNQKDDGFRGIWYSIGKTNDKYVHKYSGGLGTYPANHYPFSVYAKEVNKTFFCFGGASKDPKPSLLHEVAYYDHNTHKVSQPTVVLNKQTEDAHDNPVLSIDSDGYIWLFSTSHGVERPSYIHRSASPYSIEEFTKIEATYIKDGQRVPFNNFSYLQIYHIENQGFFGLMTHYERGVLKYGNTKPRRTIGFITSKDGMEWSEVRDLGQIEEGHYQSSGITKLKDGRTKIVSAFNYHPDRETGAGLDYRTNIYYLETTDFGKTWQNANQKTVDLPLSLINNKALILNAQSHNELVYINDIAFDNLAKPMISYITSKGPNPGSQNGPHLFKTIYFNGKEWIEKKVTEVDHNYDYGSLYYTNNNFRIIAPTGNTPFEYNNGGEIETWELKDANGAWVKSGILTVNSNYNHSYPRKPLHSHPDFIAFWADGHPRQTSISHLYFSDHLGRVFELPKQFDGMFYKVKPLSN